MMTSIATRCGEGDTSGIESTYKLYNKAAAQETQIENPEQEEVGGTINLTYLNNFVIKLIYSSIYIVHLITT